MMGAVYILLALLAVYFEKIRVPITSSIPWPNCFAFMLAVLVSFRIQRWRPIIVAAVAVCVFALFNIVTTVFGSVSSLEKLKSAIWLAYLVVIATIIARGFRLTDAWRRRGSIVFLAVGFGFLAFASLEQRTPLGALSNAFRDKVFGGGVDADRRDIILNGSIRPKAFLSETSNGARGVATLLLIGAALGESVPVSAIALTGILLAIIVFASPLPLAFAVCAILGLFTPNIVIKRKLLLPFLGAIGLVGVAALVICILTIPALQVRWELYANGTDQSDYRRTTFMAEMAGKALLRNPVSGVGLGGEMELSNEFSGFDESIDVNSLVNNAMWSIPFYTGLVGVILAIWLLAATTIKIAPQHRVLFFFTILATLNCTGSISSNPAFIVGALLFAICNQEVERVWRPPTLDRPTVKFPWQSMAVGDV